MTYKKFKKTFIFKLFSKYHLKITQIIFNNFDLVAFANIHGKSYFENS